jgi:hypothetical protein
MNKNLRKFSVLILSGFLWAACGDDDKATDPTPAVIEPEFPTEFSEKTVEQNKSALEDNGVALVNNLTDLKSSTGIQASIAFSSHLEGSNVPDNLDGGRVSNSRAIDLLRLLASLGQGKSSPTKVISGMRTAATEFDSFEQYFNDLVGVYAYKKSTDTWTYTKTGTKIVFQFPSTESGTVNNAEYAIYDYKGTKITNGVGGADYTGDYPTALKADLTVDGTKKMGYSFETAYDSKGTPTSINASITIDAFTFAYGLTNTTTEAKIDYSLTKSGTVLFAFGARSTGTFTADGVDNSDGVEDVIAEGSAYFQIMNIKFSGEIDTKALATALDAADTEEKQVAAWNANYKLIVFYADTKKKIAGSEFYVVSRTEEECSWVDPDHDDIYEIVCGDVTRKSLEVRMVFQDGSKSDLATYTDVGFNDLQDELSKFVNSFE